MIRCGSHSLIPKSTERVEMHPKASRTEQKVIPDQTLRSKANYAVRISIQAC